MDILKRLPDFVSHHLRMLPLESPTPHLTSTKRITSLAYHGIFEPNNLKKKHISYDALE